MLHFKRATIALILLASSLGTTTVFANDEKALRGAGPAANHTQNDRDMTDTKARKAPKGSKGQPTSSPTHPPTNPPTRSPTSPPTRPPTSPPTSPPVRAPWFTYAVFMGKGCAGRNELGVSQQPTVRDCAVLCDANPACISFEYLNDGTRCHLSSSCRLEHTEESSTTNAYNWYLKGTYDTSPPDDSFPYTVFMGKGCINRNELGISEQPTVRACAALCDANPACVSFEYLNDGQRCQLSSSCRLGQTEESSDTDAFNWYLKGNPVPTPDKDESCDCEYKSWSYGGSKGGCHVVNRAPSGKACNCAYKGAWGCSGEVVGCTDPDSPFCKSPDKSRQSCLQGGGDCDGYQCDCDFYFTGFLSGGCKVVSPAPKGNACKCIYRGAWKCDGKVVNCNDSTSAKCVAPDSSEGSCLEGRGDCAGY